MKERCSCSHIHAASKTQLMARHTGPQRSGVRAATTHSVPHWARVGSPLAHRVILGASHALKHRCRHGARDAAAFFLFFGPLAEELNGKGYTILHTDRLSLWSREDTKSS